MKHGTTELRTQRLTLRRYRSEEGGLTVGDCVFDKLVFEYARPLG